MCEICNILQKVCNNANSVCLHLCNLLHSLKRLKAISMARSHPTSTPPSHSPTQLPAKDIGDSFLADTTTNVEYLLKCINECLTNFAAEKAEYKQNYATTKRANDGRYN